MSPFRADLRVQPPTCARGCDIEPVSTKQRLERTLLRFLAVACAGLCACAAAALASDVTAVDPRVLLTAAWLSGLVGLICSVASCCVEGDSTDDPEYFASIVRGLRKEWQRG